MDTDELEKKVKGWFSKGAKASKKAFEAVGEKVQDFTDKSVVKLEKKQLLGKLDSEYSELGKIVYQILNRDTGKEIFNNIENDDKNQIESISNEISNLLLHIEEKEKEIRS